MYIDVRIPSYRKIEKENDKGYTVYCVDVTSSQVEHRLEKRYSEFEKLHKKVKKKVQTPPFPPKSVRKFNQRLLESRRQALEVYIQGLVSSGCTAGPLLQFLGLPVESRFSVMDCSGLSSTESLDALDDDGPTHQAILAFQSDCFQQDTSRGGLPDIVAIGVTQGLYGSADDIR